MFFVLFFVFVCVCGIVNDLEEDLDAFWKMADGDGRLVVEALPKVLALMHGKHVEDAREGLAALRTAAWSSPDLFRGAVAAISSLYDAAISVEVSMNVAKECAMTLIAVAGAVMSSSDDALACERLFERATELFLHLSEASIAQKETKIRLLAFMLQQWLESPRLYPLCSSEKRHQLLLCSLTLIQNSKRSNFASDLTKLTTAVLRRESTRTDRGTGVRLALTVTSFLEDGAPGQQCALQLSHTILELCERDFDAGLACLRSIFSSPPMRNDPPPTTVEGSSRRIEVNPTYCLGVSSPFSQLDPSN